MPYQIILQGFTDTAQISFAGFSARKTPLQATLMLFIVGFPQHITGSL